MHAAMISKRKNRSKLPKLDNFPTNGDDVRGATPERLGKAQGFVDIVTPRNAPTITTMRDSPIERAFARRVITQAQYDAAVKFRLHWYRGGMAGSLSSIDMDRVFASVGSRDHAAHTTDSIHHRNQYWQAIQQMGQLEAMVIQLIVCKEVSFYEIGNKFGWASKPRGIEAVEKMVRDSLQTLAGLWGIS